MFAETFGMNPATVGELPAIWMMRWSAFTQARNARQAWQHNLNAKEVDEMSPEEISAMAWTRDTEAG